MERRESDGGERGGREGQRGWRRLDPEGGRRENRMNKLEQVTKKVTELERRKSDTSADGAERNEEKKKKLSR